MDTIISIEKYRPARVLNSGEIKNILLELTGLGGIMSLDIENDFVRIEYFQQLLSPGLLKDALTRGGFPFQVQNKNRGSSGILFWNLGKKTKGNLAEKGQSAAAKHLLTHKK